MTTHSEKNIDKLVMEIRMYYGDKPVTLFYDRNRRRYVAQEALSRKATEMHDIPRFDFVINIDSETPKEEVAKRALKIQRMNSYEVPIPGSLSNIDVDWREE